MPHEEKVFEGMAEQKNSSQKQRNARSVGASGVAGTILPSDLVIPCWVAPLQSPTPFHQATYSVARKLNLGANITFGSQKFKTDTSAYRARRSKTDTSAYRVDAEKPTSFPLDKSESLV